MRRQRLRTTIAVLALECCVLAGTVAAQGPKAAELQQTQAQKDFDSLNAEVERLKRAAYSEHPHQNIGDAISLRQRSLASKEATLPPGSPDLYRELGDLANLHSHLMGLTQGQDAPVARAKGYYRILEIRQRQETLAAYYPEIAIIHREVTEWSREKELFARDPDYGYPNLFEAGGEVVSALWDFAQRPRNPHDLAKSADGLALAEKYFEWTESARLGDLGRAQAGYVLARLYQSDGQLGKAEVLFKSALDACEKGSIETDPATYRLALLSIRSLADINAELGDAGIAVAASLYQRIRKMLERGLPSVVPEFPYVASASVDLAAIAAERGDWASALDYLRKSQPKDFASSIALAKPDLMQTSVTICATCSWEQASRNRMSFLIHALSVYGVDRTSSSMIEEAFEMAQLSSQGGAAWAISQMSARLATGDDELARLLRKRQSLEADWLAAYREAGSVTGSRAEARARNIHWDELDEKAGEIDRAISTSFPEYSSLVSARPITVAEVQKDYLIEDEVLVFFLHVAELRGVPEATLVWVITKNDVKWSRVEWGVTTLADGVTALRCGLDASAWRVEDGARCRNILRLDKSPGDNEPLPFSAGIAHELYEALFGQVRDLIKDKHLLIVPSGPLTKLPLHVLVTQEPEAGSDFRLVAWIARENAVTVLPAVSTLKALRRVAKPSAATLPMIGFGNPLLDGDQRDPTFGSWYKEKAAAARAETGCAATAKLRTARLRFARRGVDSVRQSNGLADLDHIRVQAPLPETADELCAVARDLGTDLGAIHIGARAAESEVKSLSETGELAKYRVVQFATHGTLAGELKGTSEPGLLMTPPKTATLEDDGFLSGSEIASLKLDADWVILSACNTAGGEGSGEAAEALSGLARVFFYAGARALLVSHWAVDSAATVKLVTGAIAELAKDKSIGRAEAMRRAMLAVMVDTSRPANWDAAWHPSVWAPFVVVGEGAPAK